MSDAVNILPYAAHHTRNELRAKAVLRTFLLGSALGTMSALAAIELVMRYLSTVPPPSSIILSCGMGAVVMLPETFGLTLAIWLRQRNGPVHFRGPFCAGIFGASCGFLLFWTVLSWFIVLPIAVSFIAGLCACGQPREGEGTLPFLHRRHLCVWVLSGSLMLLLVGGGYLSATMSKRAVEQALAKKVAVDVYRRKPFKVINDVGGWGGERVFRSGGYTVIPATVENCFPWGDVGDVQIEGPFQISGKWDWCAEPQFGGGGKIVYFGFFGYIVELDEPEHYAS